MTKNIVKTMPIEEINIDYKRIARENETKLNRLLIVTKITAVVSIVSLAIILFVLGMFFRMNLGQKQALWFAITNPKQVVFAQQTYMEAHRMADEEWFTKSAAGAVK